MRQLLACFPAYLLLLDCPSEEVAQGAEADKSHVTFAQVRGGGGIDVCACSSLNALQGHILTGYYEGKQVWQVGLWGL